MNFHPHARAFWEPVRAAILFGMLGFAVGYALSMANHADGEAIRTGAAFGAVAGLIAAAVCWAMWLDVLRMSYAPQPPAAPIEEIPAEGEWFYTWDADRVTQHVIRDLPITVWDLSQYAQGLSQGKRTVYSEWIGPGNPFNDKTYKALCDWMKAWGMAEGEYKQTIILTPQGKAILRDIFERGIHPYSPTQNENGSQI
jgi:hypothetical protein